MTGLRYAVHRVMKGAVRFAEDYNDLIADINIDCASIDKDGNIVNDPGTKNPAYTQENSKKRNQKIKELLESKIQVFVYFARGVNLQTVEPSDLQAFEGFVIEEIPEPTEEPEPPAEPPAA